ncbi:hypothetical protein B0T22DRAFT_35240 [Podospora appendiculata]|uniref:Uncharacterized protein n=1 Tax=Podospora appendiculata TaxID=314037 RepID=A0AAE0XGU2_9PEZI|nr:hypothetical protein B0T22DRAFT_35240 [Podospora appendiculata]
MDHIPLPADGGTRKPRIAFPYHCDDDDACRQYIWDYAGFDTFPQRAQINVSDVCNGRVPDHDLPRSCAFLQSWLWFGVLLETLGATKRNEGTLAGNYVIEDFLTAVGTRRYLCTKKLVAALATCRNYYDRQNPQAYTPGLIEKSIHRLNKASHFLNAAVASFARKAAQLPVDATKTGPGHQVMNMLWVVLSCQILWQTIFNFYDIRLDQAWTSLQNQHRQPLDLSFVNSFFRSNSDDQRWTWTLAEIARLPRDFLLRVHLTYYPRTQLQLGPYEETLLNGPLPILPLHASVSCPASCSMKTVPLKFVDQAAGAEYCVLLFQATTPDDTTGSDVALKASNIFLDRTTKKSAIPFVAFSHLLCWGLTNSVANALPACQLKRLQSMANNCFPRSPELHPVRFWIDTLSLPVRKALTARYDKCSVDQWDIFAAASFVVAPDPLLYKTTIGSSFELVSRVRLSEWKHSIWTLEQSLVSGRPIWSSAIVRDEKTWQDQSLILATLPKPTDLGLPPWSGQDGEGATAAAAAVATPAIAFTHYNLVRLVRAFAVDIRLFYHFMGENPWRMQVETPAESESRLKQPLMMEVYRVALHVHPDHYFFLAEDELRLLRPMWKVLSHTYAGAGNLSMDIAAVRVRLERMGQFWIDYFI